MRNIRSVSLLQFQGLFLRVVSSFLAPVPDFIVTDKLQAYNEAITKEFYTNTKPRTEHVKLKNLKEGMNNNVLERLNGEGENKSHAWQGYG